MSYSLVGSTIPTMGRNSSEYGWFMMVFLILNPMPPDVKKKHKLKLLRI